MKYEFSKELRADYSLMDFNFGLSITGAFDWQQDIITEFLGSLGSDNKSMSEKCGAAWVVAKTKLKIFRMPKWQEPVFARSYTTRLTGVAFDYEIAFRSGEGELLFVMKSEVCAMDIQKRNLRRISSVLYPTDMECTDGVFTDAYRKPCTAETEWAYGYKVRSGDLDYTRHFNNVNYVKLALNALSPKFFDENRVTVLDIRFARECLYGQELEIFVGDTSVSKIFEIKRGEEVVANADMKYEKKVRS